ncbi:MAG: WYL domain-containing protein [Propionibacteriaceae bacterium]|nr:WYL domain-containing protein [Propionibacteriaceae bacterium]
MSTSFEQVARLLLEIPYIEAHPGMTVKEVAQVFSITPAQVKKDINVVIFCGLPGGYPGDLIDVDLDVLDEEGSVYMTNPTTLDRPVRMTAAEAASLRLALDALRSLVPATMAATIDALVNKLGSPEIASVDLKIGDDQVKDDLTLAISQAQRVKLTYEGRARGTTTYPVVDPVLVFVSEGVAYLTAYCVDRGTPGEPGQSWRTYRLDRIVEVSQTGQSTARHDHHPEPDAWAKNLAKSDQVTIVVEDKAAWIVDYYPTTSVTKTGDGLTAIVLPVAEPAWFTRLLLMLGSQVHKVEPESFAQRARELAQQTLEIYDQLACED